MLVLATANALRWPWDWDIPWRWDWNWFVSGQMAAVGLALGVLGFTLTLWQLGRTRGAAEAAQASSERTKSILRSSDMRRTIAMAQETARRLLMPASRLPMGERRMAAEEWLAIYARTHALLRVQKLHAEHPSLVRVMDQVAGELLITLTALEARARWNAYSLDPLRALLVTYDVEAETMLESLTEDAVAQESVVTANA